MMTAIPPHRSRAFCGVVDALGGLTIDEKRRVLGAVLELVPPPPAAPAALPLAPGRGDRALARARELVQRPAPAARRAAAPAAPARRQMHCSVCRKTSHDRRSCPDRLRALQLAQTA